MDQSTKPASIHERISATGQRYTLALPKAEVATPRPLVIALHYGGEVTPYYSKPFVAQLIEPGLRALGAVIAAPDCRHQRWDNAASEADILALIDELGEDETIDVERLLLAGYSMGGIGVWYFAARHAARLRAALAVATIPPGDLNSAEWQTPLHIIQSDSDEIFPLAPTTDAVNQLKAANADVALTTISGASHYNISQFIPAIQATVPWLRQRLG